MTAPAGDPVSPPTPEEDAGRRTDLAVERTQLAWWRTGLTALAVAIGVGRLVPELSDSETTWPYVVAGILFALYGIAMFMQGTARGRTVSNSVGQDTRQPARVEFLLAIAGPLLAVLVIALIAAT
jgi:putative membrane protein